MALNPWQQAISNLARSMGLRGQQEQQVYQTQQYQDLINQFFGPIGLPPGVDESMVVSRTPTSVDYRDAEGYIHRLERDISGVSPRLGEVREVSTNRPAILPLSQQQGTGAPTVDQTTQLTNLLNQKLQAPATIPLFDPATNPQYAQILEALNVMNEAENAAQEDAFNKAQGTALATLVGQGVGASSIAATIISELLKGQGIVRGNTQAQQAQRRLAVGESLAAQENQNTQDLLSFINNLIGVNTQRDISGAGLDLQKLQLTQQNDQFFKQLQEEIRRFDEQMRMQERQNMLNNVFKGISAVTGIGAGLSGLNLGSIGSIFSRGPNNSKDMLGVTGG